MTKDNQQFFLPAKIDPYLNVLNRLYEKSGDDRLREVVVNGALSIQEEWEYDNLNGGTFGHAVTLTVSEDLFLKIIDDKDQICDRIRDDINKLDNSHNEFISKVFVEMNSPDDNNWRTQTGIYSPQRMIPKVAPDSLNRIWGAGDFRVFFSHKSTVKKNTSRIKEELDRYGISAFVAHNDIEPTEEWQREIERALFSMDVLVALLSDDFHDSNWTDQEVGVAIGRGVPVIPVRLGLDPYGLMGKYQGAGGCAWDKPWIMANKIFKIMYKCLPDKSRFFDCAVSAYANSSGFDDSAWKVEKLLSIFDTLSEKQINRIVEAFSSNSQNQRSFRGKDLLKRQLEKWTGELWEIQNGEIQPVKEDDEMEMTF